MRVDDSLATVSPLDVAVAAGYAVVIGAVLAERAWLAVRTGSARLDALVTAAVMGVGALVAGVVIGAIERALWPVVGLLAPSPVVALLDVHVLVEVVVVFVAWDAAGFAYHWLGHRSAIGWASHQVHHSGADYDLSLAWRQTWFPVTAIVTFPLVALTGASFEVALACAVVSNTWQALLHTAFPVPMPSWLCAVVMTPRTHLRHHRSTVPVNLGPVLTIWDRLAGSWDPDPVPDAVAERSLGGAEGNPLRIETAGWRAFVMPHSGR